jgi:hypothetical protein
MEIGEFEVLPVVEEVPVICGVHATDPRRRMWHWLLQVKEMGFSGVNNFPTHCIVDGQFRQVLEETGMSVKKEFEMVALARKMDLFSISMRLPEEARAGGRGWRRRNHRSAVGTDDWRPHRVTDAACTLDGGEAPPGYPRRRAACGKKDIFS